MSHQVHREVTNDPNDDTLTNVWFRIQEYVSITTSTPAVNLPHKRTSPNIIMFNTRQSSCVTARGVPPARNSQPPPPHAGARFLVLDFWSRTFGARFFFSKYFHKFLIFLQIFFKSLLGGISVVHLDRTPPTSPPQIFFEALDPPKKNFGPWDPPHHQKWHRKWH